MCESVQHVFEWCVQIHCVSVQVVGVSMHLWCVHVTECMCMCVSVCFYVCDCNFVALM